MDETGLLTRDDFCIACAFPPWRAVANLRLLPSLTVAGQWRIFTALPVHLVLDFLPFWNCKSAFWAYRVDCCLDSILHNKSEHSSSEC